MAPPRNSAGFSEVRASPRGKSPAANSDGEMGDPAELKSRDFIRLVKQRGNRGFPAARRVVSDDSAHGARLLSAPNQRGPRPFSPAAFRPFGCLGSQPGALSSPWCPSPQPEISSGKAPKIRPAEENPWCREDQPSPFRPSDRTAATWENISRRSSRRPPHPFQIAVAPQGRIRPLFATGKPISSAEAVPPNRFSSSTPRIYRITEGDNPAV